MDSRLSPEEYIALRTAVGWPRCTPEQASAALEASLALAVVRNDRGHAIGLARAVGDSFYVVIVDVMVNPAEQENGVAHRALAALLEDPRVHAAGHLCLFAAPDAVELYESFGFRAEEGLYMRRTGGR